MNSHNIAITTGERTEVEKGIDTLLQFSMAESQIAPVDNQEFISLPLVASVFGKKKLNISPFNAAVQADTEILQMLGPSRRGDIHLGLATKLERFIANVARKVDAGEPFDGFAPILEMICRAYNPGWLLLARWHMESRSPQGYAKAKEELRRFLENEPNAEDAAEAWHMLAHASYQTGDALGEIHAFIERAQFPFVSFFDVSNTANRLNELLSGYTLGIAKEQKRSFALRILAPLEQRRGEARADDLSRMAWLDLHELLTVEDVAALLKVSKSWVYEHTRWRGIARAERLPHVKVGKYIRFEARALRAFIEKQCRTT